MLNTVFPSLFLFKPGKFLSALDLIVSFYLNVILSKVLEFSYILFECALQLAFPGFSFPNKRMKK